MAQCTIPFSVGGSALESSTTNSDSFDQKNTGLIKSNNNPQINGCGDEPPMEEVIVYGHTTSFSWGIRFWWSPSPDGSGGGTSTTTFANIDAKKAYLALGTGKRQDLANLAFLAARLLAFTTGGLSGRNEFDIQHKHGTIFELKLPSGAIIRMIVSEPSASIPIITEAAKSCG